jgi:hypothetical protein
MIPLWSGVRGPLSVVRCPLSVVWFPLFGPLGREQQPCFLDYWQLARKEIGQRTTDNG